MFDNSYKLKHVIVPLHARGFLVVLSRKCLVRETRNPTIRVILKHLRDFSTVSFGPSFALDIYRNFLFHSTCKRRKLYTRYLSTGASWQGV